MKTYYENGRFIIPFSKITYVDFIPDYVMIYFDNTRVVKDIENDEIEEYSCLELENEETDEFLEQYREYLKYRG